MSLAAVPDSCRQCTRGHHDACSLGDNCGCETCNRPEEFAAAEMRWEDPPAGRGRPGWKLDDAELAELKANPGRWARLREFKGKTTASGSVKKVREVHPGFEFVGRRTDSGSSIYGRWVG